MWHEQTDNDYSVNPVKALFYSVGQRKYLICKLTIHCAIFSTNYIQILFHGHLLNPAYTQVVRWDGLCSFSQGQMFILKE